MNDDNTASTYDKIAESWYNFRHRTIFQKELESLAARWEKGRLLNVGCAHGPDFPPFAKAFELYGIDVSPKMLELAAKYAQKYSFKVELKQADARQLPYPDNCFDYAIAVASIHHIKGAAERLKALEELKRVLKPGGEAFITVWNKWQPKFWFKRKETLVPWKQKEETLYRYYHLFSYGEAGRLMRRAGFEVVRVYPESRYKFPVKWFSRNICLLARKPQKPVLNKVNEKMVFNENYIDQIRGIFSELKPLVKYVIGERRDFEDIWAKETREVIDWIQSLTGRTSSLNIKEYLVIKLVTALNNQSIRTNKAIVNFVVEGSGIDGSEFSTGGAHYKIIDRYITERGGIMLTLAKEDGKLFTWEYFE